MKTKLSHDEAREATLNALDRIGSAVLANREMLAQSIEEQFAEVVQPGFGADAVELTMRVLATLRLQALHAPKVIDAGEMLRAKRH
jgi:hypothetical protein